MDGSYHEKVDLMVLGEASQEKRRKTNPMGFRQADFNKLGKLTRNILWETAKKETMLKAEVQMQKKDQKWKRH